LLGKLGDAAAVTPLIEALHDGEKDVRVSAAWALGELGDARAVSPLTDAASDPDPDVRERADAALGKLKARG
jgi:HEAT repeat protein